MNAPYPHPQGQAPQWQGPPPGAWGGPPRPRFFPEFAYRADPAARTLVTPEGSLLTLTLASRSDRLAALLYDFLVIILAVICVYSLPYILEAEVRALFQLALFTAFIIYNFYFIYFELAWQGTTPGKRSSRLKVISRKGGPLSPYSVVARNITRQLELFMPVMAFFLGQGLGGATVAFSLAWLFLVTLFPLWNRDRMRIGDLIADTVVIVTPSRVLAPDLAARGDASDRPRWTFTKDQLSIYGDYELMILEEILRRPLRTGHEAPLFKVAARIAGRIGASLPDDMTVDECREFLTSFYSAERAALEEGRLYGIHKYDQASPALRGAPPPPPQASTPSDRYRQGSWQKPGQPGG
ncbi:MAG: RDD family protein [Deltaproteobacteria bacterium]|jgi:uncharacterized RDD family membrane protein YckC|nr:RDD family protein [Deltaproteobacteria bacterium]